MLLVAVVRVAEGRVMQARQRVVGYALQTANAHAQDDSSRRIRDLNADVAHLLRDSLQLVERLVVQRTQKQDELDRLLRRERRARYGLIAHADSLAAIAGGAAVTEKADSSAAVRRATFRIRQAPYTLSADVVLPAAPDTGAMSVHIALDALHIETRIGCAPPNVDGIREASVTATGPTWANIRLDRVEQSPELCVSPVTVRPRAAHSWLGGVPVVIGAGSMLVHGGAVNRGLFDGIGVVVNR
jgi:hypothetical protein